MSDHGERPARAVGRVGPGEQLIRGDGTPADFLDDRDTEGHRAASSARAIELGPGEQLIRGDGTPADFLDDRDTEGHVELRRLPGDGGE